MTTTTSPAPARFLGAKAFGVLAVVGLVVAFSLSSTLVKRAESPGVLVAFWRMVAVSVVWNLLLLSTGRHITWANVRQVLVPGVFFGLNLAVFFAGATHNSVANAALIGSLAPFLIVPVGAWLFREYIDPRALVFALVAFGGVALVLFSAPANGDASLEGNVFGFLAMLLLVGYVASTKYFRQEMDVTTFMATICPIAAVAVLPLAIIHGDVFELSGTGWTYTLILAFTSGVAGPGAAGVRAEHDPDRHDRDLPGRAACARGRVVVPVAGRGGKSPADGGNRGRDRRIVGLRCAASAWRSHAPDERAERADTRCDRVIRRPA